MTEARVSVRPARPEDAAAILQNSRILAEQDGYLDDHEIRAEDIAAAMESDHPGYQCLVAELDDSESKPRIVGHAIYFDMPYAVESGPVIKLEELVVGPEDRGRGVGGALMRALAAEARQRGAAAIQLQVHVNNERARSFYEQIGARQAPDWTFYWMDRDAIVELAGN